VAHTHAEVIDAADSNLPGLVIYVVAPACAADVGTTLSCEEFRVISTAAISSGAGVVTSASTARSVASLESDVARVGEALRPLVAFADARFRAPGLAEADPRTLCSLFDALDADDACELGAEELEAGLRDLGFPADAAGTAAASLAPGDRRLSRTDFCTSLLKALERPQLTVVCTSGPASSAWPVSRSVVVGGSLAGSAALSAKTAEARRLAGDGGYGVVLVLTARGRAALQPSEYELQMRAELRAVAESLPPWPLLWFPGPPELGLLSAEAAQHPVWAMPKAAGGIEVLLSWLRYLLVVRPEQPCK